MCFCDCLAQCGEIPCVLVQNKMDLIESAKMTPKEVEALATRLNVKLFRSCVKDNLNVDDIFMSLADDYVERGLDDDANAFNASSSSAKGDRKTQNGNMTGGESRGGGRRGSDAKSNGETFKLEPSKTRTKRKTKSPCTIL
jgi:Ras-related protein Rab-23